MHNYHFALKRYNRNSLFYTKWRDTILWSAA